MSITDHDWSVRRAVPADVPAVQAVLKSRTRWLRERGLDQWPDGSPSLSAAALGAQVSRGEFRLVTADGTDPAAVVAVSRQGDPDFWTPAELAGPAVYAAKLAVSRRFEGMDLGGWLTRWLLGDAHASGVPLGRIDVWKTNLGLQDWYRRRQGWTYLRTVDADAAPTVLAAEADAGDELVRLGSLAGVTGGTVLRIGPERAGYTVARAAGQQARLTGPLAAGYPAGTVVVPGRNSGALFMKATGPDPEARELFASRRNHRGVLSFRAWPGLAARNPVPVT